MPRRNQRNAAEIPLNTDLPEDVYIMLNKFCDDRNVKKKKAVELALRRFLAVEVKKPSR